MMAPNLAWMLKTARSVSAYSPEQYFSHTEGLHFLPKDHGSCHCGAVKLAVKLKRLETWDTLTDGDENVIECNCSICVRVSAWPAILSR